jgi:pullulanase-type alpha-1,6-glucosidase
VHRVSAALLSFVLVLGLVPIAAAAAPTEGPTEADDAPDWAKEASIYHVFVDRFDDGDPTNNVDVDPTLSFDEALKDWMGGDLAGVEDRLEHIEGLGFDTIWLGPVYEGKYFHGYHPADFLNVDPNFGTNAELKQLVKAVHARGMRIVYDFVPNHTSDEHPWFQDALGDCDSPYADFYKFLNEDCTEYQSFFNIAELPELDLMTPDRPAARYLLDEVVPFYLGDLGFDGFRIDHAKGPGSEDSEGTVDNQQFLAALYEVARGIGDDKYLFGEIWSPRSQIATYHDVLDGALNFPLHDALTATLARSTSLATLDAAVRADLEAYEDGFVLTSFLDNHDTQRFVFQAGNDAAARERLKLAFTAQFTLPGSPVVYNGTEIGMGQTANTEAAGGGWVDRWYREPFPWPDTTWAHSDSEGFVLQDWHQDVADQVTDLNALRDAEPALIHGTYETVHAAGDLLLFERNDGDDRLLTVINRGADRTLDLDELYSSAIPDGVTLTPLLGDSATVTSSDGRLDVDVAGVSGEVFAVTGDLPAAPGPDTGPGPDFPEMVVLPGDFQSELGCSGDWQPFCEETALVYDARSGLWANTFTIPDGNWEYKVALDGSWDVNYGVGAVPEGPNFRLTLSEPTSITFFFDHRTGWVGNDHDNVLANVPGSLQPEVGCPGDWDPSCYRTWLQDIDGDGVYTYVSPVLPTGGYEFKVAVGGGWDADDEVITGDWGQDYGVGGGPANLSASIGEDQRLAVHFRPAGADCPVAIEAEVLGRDEAPGTPIEPCDVAPPPPPPSTDRDYAVVHYQRDAGDEDDWGLHLWDDVDQTEGTEWGTPLPFRGETDYGRFAWIKLPPGASEIGFIVYDGEDKDVDANRSFAPNATPEIWLKQGDETIYTSRAAAQGYAEIRYHRPDGDYGAWDDPSAPWTAFWGLHLWGDALAEGVGTGWDTPRRPDGVDDFGAYWTLPISDPDGELNFIIHRHDDKDPGPDQQIVPSRQPVAWIVSGDETIHRTRGSALNLAVLHYHRPAGDYGDPTSPNFNDFWGLHVWEGAASPTSWQEPVRPDRQDGFGLVFEVPLVPDASQLSYILHRGEDKDLPEDQSLDLLDVGHEVWILSGVEEYLLPMAPVGGYAEVNLDQQRAHFVSSDHIAWPFGTPADATYRLHHAAEGGLAVTDTGVSGDVVELGVREGGLPSSITTTDGFFHLADRAALTVPDDVDLDAWLTGQLAVSATTADGTLFAATGLQLPGVLDERYATDADLGVVWEGDVPSLHLWAPTAKSVTLHTYVTSTSEEPAASVPMTQDGGVWSATGQAGWDRAFYLYEVEVYVPSTGQVERNLVTDPYSFSLAMDSARSQIVQLSDSDLKPSGWDDLAKPAFGGQEQLSVYELHVRDFSANDPTVPEQHRGKYTAFTLEGTDGIEHLRALAEAGLSHLHLLPTFDIATIPEDPTDRTEPDITMPEDPASEVPQATLDPVRDLDAFNWGYDPYHFTAPEGSYSTDPDGEQRILEYRAMVGSLSDLGLRMVKDVVYNHTNAAGQHERSVLDRIVPGYYQRLSDTGVVETSTCCPNTATEHRMMDKLTIDSVLTWATEYKVDGFRFDLMGHHPKEQMLRLRAELDALTLEEHGVDGSKIVLYGEGWNFGEVANDARFVQATQGNMAGTGIGTFNDRLRDAARGGNPFGGLQEQGFVTGLAVDPNGVHGFNADQTRARVFADNVRIGMAGNLADYRFETADGTIKAGRELDYGGSPAGYAEVTTDNVVYVSKHDNETLFDAIQYKVPRGTSLDDRARVQNLGMSVVALSQGTPFFHGGSDLMRSKSLDRDSYNSGDWFNRIFWDRSFNNWGVGLPPAEKNVDNWPLMRTLLRELPAPGQEQIDRTAEHFQELLQIRASTDLFNLVTLEEVQEQLAFHATGPDAPLGVIAMSLTGGTGGITDVLVVINAGVDEVMVDDADIAAGDWELHPVQAASFDATVRSSTVRDGAFSVPARTTAVFVQRDGETDPGGPGLPGGPGTPGGPGSPPPADPEFLTCPDDRRSPFTDIEGTVHAGTIACGWGLGLLRGTSDQLFNPAGRLTRGQAATILERLARTVGQPFTGGTRSFPDVPSTHVHAEAIGHLAGAGVISGFSDGSFRPNVAVTRAQLNTLLVRLIEERTDVELPLGDPFPDVPADHVHADTLRRARGAGILLGDRSGNANPAEHVRRDQAASLFVRALPLVPLA